MKLPEEVIKEYDIGVINDIMSLHGGIIHKTWRIKTDLGTFILQKVNPIYTPSVMEDIQAVLEYLRFQGYKMTKIIKTRDKHLYITDEAGFWRMFTYIEGKTYDKITNSNIPYEAGKLLGSYHRSLANFQYNFKHHREVVNNIPLLYKKYKDAVTNNNNPEIAEMIPAVDKMIELNLPFNLRNTTNHGDPKITNVIFTSDKSPTAITMVDFDDCGKNYNVLHELADALGSWSWQPQKIHNLFDMSLFTIGLRGYCEGSQGFLTEKEWGLIPQALQLSLLQLVSRFIRDFFEDTYFEWDPSSYKSRKEHNLIRAKEYFSLYQDICKKEEEITKAMSKIKNLTK